jgi:hypothetical protein
MNTSHDDDEIDFDLLGRVHSTKSDDSIDTIRAPKQIKPQVARKIHRPHKPLKWKKSGSVFVSSAPDHPAEPTVLAKREPMLYMRTVSGKFGSEPTRYKAATEARYNLLTEKWKQVEIVLTPLHLSLYSFSVK